MKFIWAALFLFVLCSGLYLVITTLENESICNEHGMGYRTGRDVDFCIDREGRMYSPRHMGEVVK